MRKVLSHVIAVVVGFAIAIAVTVYAATQIPSAQVKYNSTTVDAALNDLYTKANTWIDPSYIDFGTLATDNTKKILASKNGICIKRNNKVSCFKANNWSEEQNHIQQVFSDRSCDVGSSNVHCYASDFYCRVNSNGSVDCIDMNTQFYCNVDSDGSVNCG